MLHSRNCFKSILALLVIMLLASLAWAGGPPAKKIGQNTDIEIRSATMGSSRLTAFHVAGLPASPTAGDTYWVDDATSACVLGAGGGGAEAEFKWDGSAWTGSLCSTGTGLAITDIDTLSELNAILGDSNLYSTAQIDTLLGKAALLGVLDLETTDSPSYAGMVLTGANGLRLGVAGTTMGLLRLYSNVAENTFYFDLFGGAAFTENVGWRVPTAMPTVLNALVNVDVTTGNMDYTDPAIFMLASNAGVAPGNYLTLQADPGQDTLYGFDNTSNTYHPIIIGTNLSYDQPTNTLSATGGSDAFTVKVDAGATADYLYDGGSGAIRAGTNVTITDNGDYISINASLTGGAVDTSGTPVQYDLARFVDADTLEGMTYAELAAVAGFETALEGVLDLADMQGVLTIAKLPTTGGTWSAAAVNPTFGTVTAAEFQSSAADGSRMSTLPNNTTGNEPSITAGESGFYSYETVLYLYENGAKVGAVLADADINTPSELETVAGLGAFASDLLGYADAAAVRTGLGLVIGTNVQAYDADHSSIAGGISGLVWGLGNGNGYQAATRANFGVMDTVGTFAAPTTTNPYTLPAANCYGSTIYYGATGEIDLPAGVDGMNLIIYNTGAFTVTIDPNASEVITRDGTAQTGGVPMTLSAGAGNYVCLIFDGTQWVTKGYKGTLAVGT